MIFLLTGITGFIGTHLYRKLLADGHQVVAQVRNKNRAETLAEEGVEVLLGDLTLFRNQNLVLPEVDCVIHLAGVVAAESLEQYDAINYQAVIDLVECLHRQSWSPKRFLFASSQAAAGPNSGTEPITEDVQCNPVDQYGIAKHRAEQYLLKNAKFPTTSFRPALVIGPGDGATLTLYRMTSKGIGFKAAGFDQLLSFVDIDDLVAALLVMSREESADHLTYFVANQPPMTTTRFFNALGKAMGRKRVITISVPIPILWILSKIMTFLSSIFRFTNQLDEKQYKLIVSRAFVCSSQRLQKRTDWKPNISLEQSLDKAVRGYKKLGQL
jgi:nucleoside-diphosphate-sugar epimerase